MRAEFLNPFVYAGVKVLTTEAGITRWVPDKPRMIRMDATRYAVNVVIGVTGRVQGIVVYGMDLSVAKGIIKAMVGEPIAISDPVAQSALGELGNLITGLASTILDENGYTCRISPPAIVRGTAVRLMTASIPLVAVSMATNLGVIDIQLGLSDTDESAS